MNGPLLRLLDANANRAREALRVLEDYARFVLDDPSISLVPHGPWFEGVLLYVLVTESVCRRPWLEAAEEALIGGADCIQLREKGVDGGELLRRAKQLVDLCGRYGVPSVVNDRPDVALL